MLILVPIFMSTMSMPLQNSDMDIKDMKIGTRINTETVFQGPETVSLDLFLNFDILFTSTSFRKFVASIAGNGSTTSSSRGEALISKMRAAEAAPRGVILRAVDDARAGPDLLELSDTGMICKNFLARLYNV